MVDLQEILDAVSEELGGVASGDTVVGSPVKLGAATVYPISIVHLGLGGGGGQGEREASSQDGKGEAGAGNGGVAGFKAKPVAVLVFQEDAVTVLPLPVKAGPLERFLERLPDLIERFKDKGLGKSGAA
ncbi:GerW family sporulation protein [Anaeromyxobacter oryzae]|uniref:Sporulation protein YtfJ n=1 Tax=Anaeromyxobacter oryzae TaxID=2918170 RepID=A0ABM7WU01_9BACT|nr:spore germination protein GerW family protein [Anaeromyxobacter oryzae]BDG02867.1 hypothetical protein AMOR_18630 [Anaeromyxobacter oryzae]